MRQKQSPSVVVSFTKRIFCLDNVQVTSRLSGSCCCCYGGGVRQARGETTISRSKRRPRKHLPKTTTSRRGRQCHGQGPSWNFCEADWCVCTRLEELTVTIGVQHSNAFTKEELKKNFHFPFAIWQFSIVKILPREWEVVDEDATTTESAAAVLLFDSRLRRRSAQFKKLAELKIPEGKQLFDLCPFSTN